MSEATHENGQWAVQISTLKTRIQAARDHYDSLAIIDPEQLPIERYLNELATYPRDLSYDYVSREVATHALLIKHKHGDHGMYYFHAIALIQLIERNYQKLIESEYPEEIKSLSLENLERILDTLIAGEENADPSMSFSPPNYLYHGSDRFAKDLSAATLRMLVFGGRKLCRVKFPIGLLKTHPVQMATYIAKHGASGSYLETHFDSNDIHLKARFGEESWHQVLRNVGRVMQNDSSITGFVGHSWYYDPCLREVAPNLSHIGGTILDNGGSVFCTGISESTTESALRNSTVRQGLYELGLYQPKRFKILWPRKAVLQWASNQR